VRIRLDQHAIVIQAAQKFLKSTPLTGFVGVVGLLGQSDAKGPGVDADLTDIDAVGRRP
jgi:hypothetical protein